ncbi:hypothetical protein FE782_01945 [Paenibacillus antri]|uniref:IstB-like ATP-binding domain-containing protein n=1 Tax=Paenibacillus antri TaxID=2582848 RepID=A0A5R9GCD8_9BACL|nr:hypothetical protein FE782_01945 [Paenibacillus antri]
MVITSNKSWEWDELMSDAVLATTVFDRILRNTHLRGNPPAKR